MNALVEPSVNNDSFSYQSDSYESQSNVVAIEQPNIRKGPTTEMFSNLHSNLQT